jgi:hypothetical protein
MRLGHWLAAASLIALPLLSGCASEPEPSRVQAFGDKYFVNYNSIFGAGSALSESIRDANGFCEAKGLRMSPESNDRGVLIFRCVPAAQVGTANPEVSAPKN